MADIKWVKLKTGMFNDDRIKVIQAMPEGDALIVVWIRMLILAGISNADGYLMISGNLPYTEDMLAIIFGKPLSVIRLALKTFEAFGMIESCGEGIYITDFADEQGGKMQDIQEYNRKKKAESRERARQRLLGMTGQGQGRMPKACQEKVNDVSMTGQENVNDMSLTGQESVNDMSMTSQRNMSMTCQGQVNDMSLICQGKMSRCQDTDIDKDKEKDISIINNTPQNPPDFGAQSRAAPLDYERIALLYNTTCKDLPKVRGISDERRRKIRTLLNSLDKAKVLKGIEPYERLEYIFRLADESDFLSGRVQANSWCGFDWLVNAKNALKVIEGNYKNNGGAVSHGNNTGGSGEVSAEYSCESENDALAAFRAGLGRDGGGGGT